MDNEINENNNKSNQDTFENPPKISFYKINILAAVENANINENKNEKENKENINKKKKANNSKKNLLLLEPFSNKLKLKKSLKNILESSFRSKRSSMQDQDKNKDNPKDDKLNIIVVNNNENENLIKVNELISPNLISPRKSYNLNEKNNDSEFNLCKLAEQLYENEEHFQKNIIPKKGGLNDSLNTMKKNDSYISEEIIKKKVKNNYNLIIDSTDKDQSNANLLKEIIDKNKDDIKRKSNVSNSSKGKSSNYNIKKSTKKNNFSNFKKIKFKDEVENKEYKEEDKISIKKRPKFSNNMLNNSRTLKQNFSSKPLRLYDNKKPAKEDTEIKIKNSKKKSSNKNKNNQSQINDNTKNEKTKNNKRDNKDKSFCYFCCLNNKDNDSDEYCK
jgi:hypothetical protein